MIIYRMQTGEEILASLINILQNLFNAHLQRIILYGSYARNEETNDSDIDFMVLTDLENDELKKFSKNIANISVELSLKYVKVFSIVLSESHGEDTGRCVGVFESVRYVS
jgi:predicted nucleotidyltransferase